VVNRAHSCSSVMRPHLVPILDRLVAEMMGVNLPGSPTVSDRVAVGQRLAAAIRREGRCNTPCALPTDVPSNARPLARTVALAAGELVRARASTVAWPTVTPAHRLSQPCGGVTEK
jgi:hypothetical protein